MASVHEHARFFALQADRYGGGHIRTSLAAYLSGLVRPLRCGEESAHHRGMLAGGARLSYLLARVYADEQRHGLAQRAFLTAAELAGEAGDPEGVALARRALSSQAHQLGHPRASLALAEAACEGAPADSDPSTRAFLYAGLAVAEAAGGDRNRALAALRRAEHQLARAPADLTTGPASPGGEPVGSYQGAALLYQSSQLRTALATVRAPSATCAPRCVHGPGASGVRGRCARRSWPNSCCPAVGWRRRASPGRDSWRSARRSARGAPWRPAPGCRSSAPVRARALCPGAAGTDEGAQRRAAIRLEPRGSGV